MSTKINETINIPNSTQSCPASAGNASTESLPARVTGASSPPLESLSDTLVQQPSNLKAKICGTFVPDKKIRQVENLPFIEEVGEDDELFYDAFSDETQEEKLSFSEEVNEDDLPDVLFFDAFSDETQEEKLPFIEEVNEDGSPVVSASIQQHSEVSSESQKIPQGWNWTKLAGKVVKAAFVGGLLYFVAGGFVGGVAATTLGANTTALCLPGMTTAGGCLAGATTATTSGLLPAAASGIVALVTSKVAPIINTCAALGLNGTAQAVGGGTLNSIVPNFTQFLTNASINATGAAALNATGATLSTGAVAALGTGAVAVGAMLVNKIAPLATGTDGPAPLKIYTKKGVVCNKGTFDIEVPGPKGLSRDQQQALFDAFVKEMLEKCPLHPLKGDKLEFHIPPPAENEAPREWSVNLEPSDDHKRQRIYEGKPELLSAKRTYQPSDEASIGKLEILNKVMVQRASAVHVMESLSSITTQPVAFNVATHVPVGFTIKQTQEDNISLPPAFCAALQMLLADPHMRKKMENSNHSEVQKIAREYAHKMAHSEDRSPIDIKALLLQLALPLNTDPSLAVSEYALAIRNLMRKSTTRDNEFSDLMVRRISIDPNATDAQITAELAKPNTPLSHTINVSPTSGSTASLQTLVNSRLLSTTHKMIFKDIPSYLEVNLKGPAGERDVSHDLTIKISSQHIDSNKRPTISQIPYRIDGFYTSLGITYRRTIELVNGLPQHYFWKLDPAENGTALRITEEQFRKAARTAQHFRLQATNGRLEESEILANRAPVVLKKVEIAPPATTTPGAPPANPTEISFEYGVVNPIPEIAAAATSRDSSALHNAVQRQLAALNAEGKTTVSLAVPESNGPWATGIMWYAIQEHVHNNPGQFRSIKLAAMRNSTIKKEDLIARIDEAQRRYAHNHP